MFLLFANGYGQAYPYPLLKFYLDCTRLALRPPGCMTGLEYYGCGANLGSFEFSLFTPPLYYIHIYQLGQ